MKKVVASIFALAFSFCTYAAPITLDGMGQIIQWTDFESSADDMPGFIWGTSDIDGADKIGLFVELADGRTGSLVWSGVSALWNTYNFLAITPDIATGFFDVSERLHFLCNSAQNQTDAAGCFGLPMATTGGTLTDISGNFDLDYREQNGGEFRASRTGWNFVTFTTFSSTASVANVSEPTALAILLMGMAGLVLRRRK